MIFSSFILLFFGINFILYIGSDSITNTMNKDYNFLEYENPYYKFKMSYPQDWIKTETDPNKNNYIIKFQPANEEYTKVFLEIHENHSTLNLEQYTLNRINELQKSFSDLKIIEQNYITLTNEQTQNLLYTFSLQHNLFKKLEITIIKDDITFSINYISPVSSFDKYLSLVNLMLKSFKFNNQK